MHALDATPVLGGGLGLVTVGLAALLEAGIALDVKVHSFLGGSGSIGDAGARIKPSEAI